jgi:tetratricopeptide (TPR) repeat protein
MPLTQNIMRPWTGFREQLRQRPRASAAVVLVTVGILGAGAYFLLAPHLWAEYHWWQAQRSLKEYQFPEAVGHLQCCLQIWPRSAATHFQIGRAYRRQGDIANAREHLQKAYVLRYPVDDLQLEFHLIEAQTGAVQAVEPKLIAYLAESHPDELLIYEALVKGYWQHSFFVEGYHWATKWIQRFPKDWNAYYFRALVLERGQKFREAVEDFTRVLELNPNHFDARLHLADMLVHVKRLPEALEQYKACAQQHPDSAYAGVGIGRCLMLLGRDAEARSAFESLLTKPGADRDKNLADGFRMYGQLEAQQDRPEAALPLLKKAVALAPTNSQANRHLAAVLRTLGQDAEAQRCEDKAQITDRTYIRLDQIVTELGQIGPLVSDPAKKRAVELRYEAGMSLLRIGHDEDGVGWLVSASQIDGTHEKTKKALKDYYNEKGALLDKTRRQ